MVESATEIKKKTNLPAIPWMRDPVDINLSEPCPLDSLPFLDPRLKMALLHNTDIKDMASLFPVQVAVWHETIGPGSFDRDLCINSPTGSGKTLSYVLPIVQMLSTRVTKCLRALVVLPTRDLAVQVKEVFDYLAPAVGLSVGLAVGQSSMADDISMLIKKPELKSSIFYDPEYVRPEPTSAVDILIATPGRLMDHIDNTDGFTLEHLQFLVVDETDRLLRESYQSWLPTVLQSVYYTNRNQFPFADNIILPTFGSLKTIRSFGVDRGFKGKPHPRLVKMVLSATLTKDPSKIAQLNLHHPFLLTTVQKRDEPPQRYYLPEQLKSFKVVCKSKLKPLYLLALLESLKWEKCIVFTSSVESTHRLCTLLNFFDGLQIKFEQYSRSQPQAIRSKTLRAFRAGRIQVLICSDLISRGMDVKGVKVVINYDMPAFTKTYVHRAGRTARAGQVGSCFTLLRNDEVKKFKKLLQKAGNESCPDYSVPSESVESFRLTYNTALERLKESIESGKIQRRQGGKKEKKVLEETT
ncbi:hypothetical protein ACP275_13G185800 [Erythranthe tilingii]